MTIAFIPIHPVAEQLREAQNELDAAVEQFDARMVESIRPVEAALDKLHAILKSEPTWNEDSTEAQNFTLWRAQFLGLFLDDLELAIPENTHGGS